MEDFTQQRDLVHGNRYKPDGEPPYENYSRFGSDSRKRRSLPRTISAADVQLVEQYQSVVARDYVSDAPEGGSTFFANTPMYTLALPVIENRELREFVLDLLRDSSVQRTLEMEHVINWSDSLTALTPLKTISDGNCLLHAASLAMWGFQDRKLFLRQALNSAMESKTRNTLYDRWEQVRDIENRNIGLTLDSHEWADEWRAVKRQTSTDKVVGANVDSLDDFHVFVLANVLRRPIIMYASPKIRSLASGGTMQKLYFSGVYLPLLWDPSLCKRSPLPLAYCNGHFSALTMMESPDQYNKGQLVLPLVDSDMNRLPVKFAVRMEDPRALLHEYLDITEVRASQSIPCCKLTIIDANKTNNYTYRLAKTFVQACLENLGRGLSSESLFSERQMGGGNRHQEMKPYTQNFHRPREEDSPPEARSKTTIQPARGRGTVKCSECSEPGLPQFLGRCERCHNRIQSGDPAKDEDSIYEPIPSPNLKRSERRGSSGEVAPALPIPRDQSQRSQCRTPGCDFFGTKEFRFYCSKCFDANMEKILKEVDEGPPVAPVSAGKVPGIAMEPEGLGSRKVSSGSKDPAKCYSCREFFGSPELNGLCNKCFLKSTEKKEGKPPSDPFQQKKFQEHQDRGSGGEKYADEPKYGRRDGGTPDYSIPAPMKKKQSSSDDLYLMNSQMGKLSVQAEACVMCRKTNIAAADSEAFILCRKHTMQLMGIQGSTSSRGDQGAADELNRGRSVSVHPWNDAGDDYSGGRDKFSHTQPISKTSRNGYDPEFDMDDPNRQFQKREVGYDSSGTRRRVNTEYSSSVQQNNARLGFDDTRDFHHRSVDFTAGSVGGGGGGRGYHTGGIDTRGEHGRNLFDDEFSGGRSNRWEDQHHGDTGDRGRRFDVRDSDWNSNRPGGGKFDSRMGVGDSTGYRLGGDDRDSKIGMDDRSSRIGMGSRDPRNSFDDRGHRLGGDDRGARIGIDDRDHRLGGDGRGARTGLDDRGYRLGGDDRGARIGIDDRGHRLGGDDRGGHRLGGEDRGFRIGMDNRGNRLGGDDRGNRLGGDDRGSRLGGDDRGSRLGGDDRGNRLGGDDRGNRLGGDDRGNRLGGDDRGNRLGGDDRGTRIGANGRGGTEELGAAGAGGMDLPSKNKLCVEPGCSYYAYRALDFRCPNCYELVFKKPVDRDLYPEV